MKPINVASIGLVHSATVLIGSRQRNGQIFRDPICLCFNSVLRSCNCSTLAHNALRLKDHLCFKACWKDAFPCDREKHLALVATFDIVKEKCEISIHLLYRKVMEWRGNEEQKNSGMSCTS